jgi:hypothetical protein
LDTLIRAAPAATPPFVAWLQSADPGRLPADAAALVQAFRVRPDSAGFLWQMGRAILEEDEAALPADVVKLLKAPAGKAAMAMPPAPPKR